MKRMLILLLALLLPVLTFAETTEITFGEPVETSSMLLTVDGAFIDRAFIGSAGSGVTFPPSEKSRYFILTGTIENVGFDTFSTDNLNVEFKFNNKYKYEGEAYAELDGRLERDLDALYDAPLYIVAEIPVKLLDRMEDCVITFYCNDDMTQRAVSMESSDVCFTLSLDGAAIESAKAGRQRTVTYFEECPALPDPTSLVDVRMSSHRGFGRIDSMVTDCSYSYIERFSDDEAKPLFEKYISLLPEYGCTVSQNGDKYQLIISGKVVGTLTYDKDRMTIELKAGNENMQPSTDKGKITEGESGYPRKAIGSTIDIDPCKLTLERGFVTDRLLSSITERSSGYYQYYYPQDGSRFWAVFGRFTNKTGNSVDIRNIYCVVIIDGKYTYPGSVCGVVEDSSNFVDRVSPMQTIGCYLYAEIPQSVLDNATTCVMRVGFTPTFYTKVIVAGEGPKFSLCSDVFEIVLK